MPKQTRQYAKAQRSNFTSTSIDFAKISGDIRAVSEKVKKINAELRNILEELEGFSSDDADVQARLQALQGKVRDAADLTDDARGMLNECETESEALRPLVSQTVPAKTGKALHGRENRAKNQSEPENSDGSSRSRRFVETFGFGKERKKKHKTENEDGAREELVELEKTDKKKSDPKRMTPIVYDVTDE